MARYVDIECDAVTEVLPRRAFKTRQDIQDFLDNIPTVDVTPVIRCKNCKYAYINPSGAILCSVSMQMKKQDGFCDDGDISDGGADIEID